MVRFICASALLLVVASFPSAAGAQDGPTSEEDVLSVFIDCPFFVCDFDYFRTEIPFVNYVRDRQDADVHLLVSTERTGGGGTAFTLSFIGQREFQDVEDVLSYTSDATATDDETREGLVRIIRVGLLGFIGRTPLIDRFEVVYSAPVEQETQMQAEDDPWNFWVFNTRVSAFANGEDRYQLLNLSGSATASRVTEQLKLRISTNGSRRSQRFELSDGSETVDVQETYGASGLAVVSVGPRWSAGMRTSALRSSRLNYDLNFEVAPAVEFNVFPYSVSTRKLLTFQYSAGLNVLNYADTTLFNVIAERRFRHAFESSVSARQPWGTVRVSLDGAQYVYDPNKFNMSLGGNVELRLFRGFSVNLGGNVSFVRDQLYLPKGDASDEDVLLRRRQLATDWRYFFQFGIGYTFGSRFNNVVNPRFDGGGGGRVFFF